MTEIKEKALALVNEVLAERELPFKAQICPLSVSIDEALCRAIEKHEADKAAHAATVEGILKAHEAYKQEVSDAVEKEMVNLDYVAQGNLGRFILPKPDPLVEVIEECEDGTYGETKAEYAAKLRAALAKRGFKIVETFTHPDNV